MTALDGNRKLVRMANQIASFFRSYPDEEAVAGIAKHVQAFWTPKMRADMARHLDGAEDLDPLVRRALAGSVAAASPVEPRARDPHLAGAAASDAG